MSEKVISIATLVNYVKNKFDTDFNLRNVAVQGEIVNFNHNASSGHWYFALKDENFNVQIKSAMFYGDNRHVSFKPKNGDKVIVVGNVSLYEVKGDLQLIVKSMQLAGVGNFYIQFEQTKKKLEPLGYFDAKYKKPLNKYPSQISIVAGASTAALQDIRDTLANRWPMARLVEDYAVVQGEQAVSSIVRALQLADTRGSDVIILARGGGSIDDLWCFNGVEVAKAILAC